MTDFSNVVAGFFPCKVLLNGEPKDVRVDLYDANQHLWAIIESMSEAERTPAVFKAAAVSFFEGHEDDWSGFTATAFWKAVTQAVEDLKKGDTVSNTPS